MSGRDEILVSETPPAFKALSAFVCPIVIRASGMPLVAGDRDGIHTPMCDGPEGGVLNRSWIGHSRRADAGVASWCLRAFRAKGPVCFGLARCRCRRESPGCWMFHVFMVSCAVFYDGVGIRCGFYAVLLPCGVAPGCKGREKKRYEIRKYRLPDRILSTLCPLRSFFFTFVADGNMPLYV